MTRVRLGRRFDAVLCLFDSINHLLRWARWEALFDRAGEHLEPNGVFVFHVNTPSRLAALAAGQPWVPSFYANLLVFWGGPMSCVFVITDGQAPRPVRRSLNVD